MFMKQCPLRLAANVRAWRSVRIGKGAAQLKTTVAVMYVSHIYKPSAYILANQML